MNSTTNKVEAVAASIGTGASLAACVAEANQWLQFAIAVATFAYWLRLWVKDPNKKPPTR